jgi:hypothetical protein
MVEPAPSPTSATAPKSTSAGVPSRRGPVEGDVAMHHRRRTGRQVVEISRPRTSVAQLDLAQPPPLAQVAQVVARHALHHQVEDMGGSSKHRPAAARRGDGLLLWPRARAVNLPAGAELDPLHHHLVAALTSV